MPLLACSQFLQSKLVLSLLIVILSSTNISRADQPNPKADQLEFFERKVRPLLSEHCYSCHSSQAKTIHGSLRLDSVSSILEGGDSGKLLVPGKPEESLLIESIRYDGDYQMPPKGKMAEHEIELLTKWVEQGAYFPTSSDEPIQANGSIDFTEGRKHWSFQPVLKQDLPDVNNPDWPQTRIDTFLLAEMEQKSLKPTMRADRTTLVRRLSFDLIGLPPTPEQIHNYIDDDSSEAYARLVDQLLNSPQYGEKWGRWWLDLARYTDRTASWLPQTSQAHLYRDWVVNAFNADMPYDEFIRRQLATDLMPETGPEDLPALGFLSLSPTYWKELKLPCEVIKVIVADEWEERVDAVSRTFLGLTVACARCHDHKFDPISADDYYALAGIFASTRFAERPLISKEKYEPVRIAKEEVGKFEAEIAKLKKEKPIPQEKIDELVAKIAETKASTPDYDTPMANALVEESTYVVRAGKTPQDGTRMEYRAGPRDLPSFIRGNPNRPGPVIPRRFLTVLTEEPEPYQNGSGRLELANSITTDAASLSARVIVNRIWMAHFGQGIVDTPSNFGRQGGQPTHPELLEDLAARFISQGWSIKQLHREILLSAAWQQSSNSNSNAARIDPENRLLSHMNRHRLGFEEWRDAMLFVSGSLDPLFGGPSVALDDKNNVRRTLYATVNRRDMSPTLMIHDFPDPTQHSPKRTTTTTALQGLYALNGELLAEQSKQIVDRLFSEFSENDRTMITQAYWLLFSREPTVRELELGLSYLGNGDEELKRWQQYIHVLLASNEFVFID